MILADTGHFYVIDMGNQSVEPLRFEQRCAGLYLSDNNFMYTLTHKNGELGIQSGFRLYDIENCISSLFAKPSAKAGKSSNGGELEE